MAPENGLISFKHNLMNLLISAKNENLDQTHKLLEELSVAAPSKI
jgi:hypothetical protein